MNHMVTKHGAEPVGKTANGNHIPQDAETLINICQAPKV